MYQLFVKCIEYLFPQSAESLLVDSLNEKELVTLFNPRHFENIYVLSRYTDQRIRALIHEAKFHINTRAWELLHTLFSMYIQKEVSRFDYIIPIPLSRERMRTRGYNQVHAVLRTGTPPLQISIETTILERTRNTRPQTELRRNERLTNMHNAFMVKDGSKITNKHILLIDDVTTTGATLNAAKAALLPHHPASVTLLAIAH